MTAADVSVVIATRDRPELLGDAIASARGQTRPPAEIIVVDDGSSPPVALALEESEGPVIRLLRFEASRGPGAARNAACDLATGSFVAFLDDDDRWRPDKLERQTAALAADPSAGAVVCGWELRDDDVVLRQRHPDPSDGLGYLAGPTAPPSVLLVRTRVFQRVGGFDPALQFGEDWDLVVRLVEQGPVIALPDILVERTAHPNRRFGRRLITDHRAMMRRLAPRVRALDLSDRLWVRGHHVRRLGLYASRVALEPLVVGRLPWRARRVWRRRRRSR